MVTLYNVTSNDGFIARLDGDENFISDDFWDYFIDLCKNYDTLVMGSKTYEAIQNYPIEMSEQLESLSLKRIVVTKDINYPVKSEYKIINSIKDIQFVGKNILVSSGPGLNTSIAREGIADKVILIKLPEKIGAGIPVFEKEIKLNLISEKDFGKGRKLCGYKIDI